MDFAPHTDSGVSPSIQWSVYAALYMFIWGTAIAFLLSDLLTLLADVIGLPAGYAMAILASPVLVIGTLVWWILVERRGSYTYLLGATFGLVTALLTGLLWTARFVDIWGSEVLTADVIPFLVVFVLGVTTVTGVLTGIPLMYARRRLDGKHQK